VHHQRAAMVEYEEDQTFWDKFNTLSKNKERPKRNSFCIVVLAMAGIAGVVVFSILAVTTLNQRTACPCANPYKNLGNGERLYDIEQCQKDMTYMACYRKRTQQHTTFAGLAGGFGGLLLITLLMYLYG
jgi:hypothetical protein